MTYIHVEHTPVEFFAGGRLLLVTPFILQGLLLTLCILNCDVALPVDRAQDMQKSALERLLVQRFIGRESGGGLSKRDIGQALWLLRLRIDWYMDLRKTMISTEAETVKTKM